MIVLRVIALIYIAYWLYRADQRRLTRARLAAFAKGVTIGATRTLGDMDIRFYAQQIYNANEGTQ